jgi:xanthine/CO dehydrogenase XdhC/CoxF family maturation factor
MDDELPKVVSSLNRERAAYAVATVVQTQGSASVKPSSTALIDAEGRMPKHW